MNDRHPYVQLRCVTSPYLHSTFHFPPVHSALNPNVLPRKSLFKIVTPASLLAKIWEKTVDVPPQS